MDIKGNVKEVFSQALKETILLSRQYYIVFIIPVVLGTVWGIVSQTYISGGMIMIMKNIMHTTRGPAIIKEFSHFTFVLMLSMIVSILIWVVTFAGAGLLLKHRNETTTIDFDEVFSYTGNKLGSLIVGGFSYIFLPFLPVLVPFLGIIYGILFILYIFFVGKNYGGFFFWAYPVIAENKGPFEGFTIAKEAVLTKKNVFWSAWIRGFLLMWILGFVLQIIPYIGSILTWSINLMFIVFTGLLYYDYKNENVNISMQ
ncbi:MAG: hypothetical protein M1381_11570 [Deltaproteobacteria bacterium]|nr:hypothetical protein [Deltaproteobacteria bacterium]MCL5878387.1 hypothetical protein [Deltaproteobacteria bacterium]